jgi:hypothetical protein
MYRLQSGTVTPTHKRCQTPRASPTAAMVSLADQPYHMFNTREEDFPLYPEPTSNTFPQQPFHNSSYHNGFDMDQNPYSYTREAYPTTTGFNSNSMYVEAPNYALESPEMRAVPSNYSAASGASTTSSAVGSPHSVHGNIVPVPEWAPHGLGLNPSIVTYDNFAPGNEYMFNPTGMEEFTLDFNLPKTNSFVGECKNISRSVSRQHGSISSTAEESVSSLSTSMLSPRALDMTIDQLQSPSTSRSMASPKTPVSAVRSDFRDARFKFPSVSASSLSPTSSRRPSQSFNTSHYAPSSAACRSKDMRASPVAVASQFSFAPESTSSFTTYHQSPFFSQSSGNFVPPLESSCRFPLSFQRYSSAFRQRHKE